MVLRSWFTAGLVPEAELLEYFRTLRSRRNIQKGNGTEEGDDSDIDL